MAEDNGPIQGTENDNLDALNALFLDGQSTGRLDDAVEHEADGAEASNMEDVKGLANVQSSSRATADDLNAGGTQEAAAAPAGADVVAGAYDPTETDNSVDAAFDNTPEQEIPSLSPASAGPQQDIPDLPRGEDELPEVVSDVRFPDGEGQDDPAQYLVDPVVEDDDPSPIPDDDDDDDETVVNEAVLTVEDPSGIEGIPTKLEINAFADGSGDSLDRIEISGVPDYFEIVDSNGNPVGSLSGGTWVLTNPSPAQLDNLYLRNIAYDEDGDYSGTFDLTVTAYTEEDGIEKSIARDMTVYIEAVADAPGAEVTDAAGMENTWISLDIDVTDKDVRYENGVDVDTSETQTVYISDVPSGAQLNHGTVLTSDLTLEDGTVISAGSWVVDPADLGDLAVLPGPNSSKDFNLTVRVASTEESNGDVAVTGPLTIEVDVGLVDPSGSASGATTEDQLADLTMSASINQADGTEILTAYIEDLPDGAILVGSNGVQLTADAQGRYDVTAYRDPVTNEINGLKVGWDQTTDAHSDEDISFNLRVVVTDGDTDVDTAAIQAIAPDTSDTIIPVTVEVAAVADAPTLSASAIGVEDQWFSLDIDSALVDTDGSETLSVSVTGDASDFSLRDADGTPYTGTDNGDGTVTYTFTPDQLETLQIRGAQDSDADFNLDIVATATEGATGDQVSQKTATTSTTVNVKVLSDADTPTIDVVSAPQTINEDTLFNLRTAIAGNEAVQGSLSEAGSADGDLTTADGSETLHFVLTAQDDSVIVVNGVRTELSAGDSIELSAADVFNGNVLVGGRSDWASSSATDTLKFDLKTVATESNDAADDLLEGGLGAGNSRDGVAESESQTLTLVVNPVADSASIVASNAGFEDGLAGLNDNGGDDSGTAIALTPTITFTDTDGSEQPTGNFTITSDDPTMINGTIMQDGDVIAPSGPDANGNYTWTFTNANFNEGSDNVWTLQGVTFMPADDASGTVNYDLSIEAFDSQASATRTVDLSDASVTLEAVADVPTVSLDDAQAMETASGALEIPLDISINNPDVDGSESQAVYITGIPASAGSLNVGTVITSDVTVDGVTISASADNPVYLVTADDLSGLKLSINEGNSEDLALNVYGVSTESSNGDQALSGPHALRVDIGVGTPTITVGTVAGNEDTHIALGNVRVEAFAPDATDTMTVYIEDIADGVSLYQQNDGGGYTELTPSTYTTPDGVTHTGYKIPADLIGANGELSGVFVKNDADGSDADINLTVRTVVQDVDADASLDAGGIDMNTAIGQPYADSAQTTQSVTVEVAAVADKAATSISGKGIEDQWFDLNLTATLQDTDGSEQITEITLTVPHDVLLQQADGTPYDHDVNSNGTWTYTIPKESLGDVQAKAPQDSDANIKVIMKVTTTDTPTDGDPTPDTAVKTHSKWINIVSDADTPTLQVVDETQIISEDAFFNLNADIDPSTPGVQSAVSGALTEAGANAMDGESPDTSETLTFNVEAQQDSRIWIDADGDGVRDAGEVQTLTAGQSVEVTAEQIANNQVHVGGVENWASDDASDTLKFDITAVATEDREQGTSTVNGVERSGTAESDTQTLTLGVEAVADRTYVSAVASGVEDQVGGVPFNPVIRLEDTDGSESLTGTVDILIAQGSMDGHLELDGNPMSATSTVTVNGVTYDVYEVPVNTLEDRGNGRFQVDDVKYIPNEHSDKDFSYRIRTTTTDSSNGDSYTTVSSSGNLVIKAIVDAPEIEVNAGVAVVGDEDTVIPLNLSAQLQDQDGSETLTNAELQNVPDGWSVAYVNADGSLTYATQAEGSNTWVLDPSRIGDVALKPPLNADADASGIKFIVTSTEHAGQSGGDTQIVSGKASTTVETTFDVTLNAVADTPNLVVTDVRMLEDTTTQLDIRPALTDTDGSEVLSFTIADVPPGAQLVDQNGVAYTADNGVYTFTPDQANKIYYKPAANSNDDAALKVTAISTEQGDASSATASRTSTLNVTVTGVADAPHDPSTGQDLTDGSQISASGVEGQLIDPGLEAFHSLDVDGSEALSVVLSNIPDGVKVVLDGANTDQYVKYLGKNADGHDEWSVAPDYVDNVRFLAPDDYAGTFNVGVRLISTENDGDAAIVDTTLQVNVTPVTDAPRGWIGKSTSEDSWIDANGDDVGIPFSLNAQVTDTGNSGLEGDSGTETLSDIDVTVDVNALVAANGGSTAGIYVTFNGQQYNPVQNANGKYVIEINDIDVPNNTANTTLSGFKLFGVPEHSSTDVPISMKITAQDGSDVAEASTTVNGEISITPVADAPLLSIDPPEGAGNPSGPSEVTITFEGESASYHNTLGYYKIDPDTGRITDVKLIWENASSQGSGGNLDPGTTTETLDLQDGDTFGVFLIADGFDYNNYGSLPAGHFEFQNADGSLASLGSDQPKLVFVPDDNTIPPITMNAPKGIYHTAGFGDKVSLNNDDRVHTDGLKAPENGELTLGFEDLSNLGDRDYNDSMFTINFGSADVDFENPHYVTDPDVYTFTDGALTLSGDFGVQDTDGSETAYLVISGVPNGVSIEGGINNGDGSWTLPNGTSIGEIVLNSANTSAGQADLTVTMHVVDNDPDSSARDTASASVTIPVFYGDSTSGGGGTPTSFASADVSGSLSTLEDNSLGLSGLTITATGSDGTTSLPIGADGSTAEGAVSIVIDVPPGWTISGGVYAVDADTYTVPYGNLSSVRLTPPADYAGEDYDLNIRAMVTRNDGWYDPDDADMTAIDISVAAVTDGARLSASLDAAAVEDTAVGIDLTITAQDTDLSEVLETGEVTLTLSNVDGEQPGTLSGNGVVQNPDDSYTLQLSAAQIAEYQNSGTVSVDGLTFTPADNFSGSVRLTYSVDVKDGDAASKTSENGLTFNVAAEVDTTEITANNVTGQEDAIGGIPLDVTIKHEDLAVSDADWGSETMSVVIEGVPAGATIEGAYNNGGGRWSVKDGNVVEDPAGSGTYVLQNVKYIPPLDDSTDAQLTVKTYSRESGSTEIEVGSASFGVTVTAQTDGATLDPQTAVGIEDQLVALNLNAQLLDQTETATITVSGLPSGAQLTDVNGDAIGTVNSDGSVTLTMAEAGNVYFSGPAQVADTWELSAKITTTDLDTATDPAQNPGATVTSDAFTFTVTTTPDADAPTLSGGNTSGAEDTWISVDLTGLQTVDTDGSETLSVVISGAPEGTVFQTTDGTVVSATTVNGERVWVIPANEDNEFRVDGIQMKTPEDFNGTVDLTAKAVSTEGGSRADSDSVDVSVTVTAVNDAPDVDITSSTSLPSGTIQSPILLLNSLSTASISDVDSSAVSQMVITIGDQQAGDSLGLDGVSPVMNADGNMVVTIDGAEFTVSYANGAMTISGSGTMDQYESVLSHVTFTSSTGTLGAGARTISVAVTDAEGATGTDSDAAAIQVDGTLTLTDAAQGDVYFSDNGTVHLADQSVGSDVSAAIPALTGVSLSGEATDMMSGMTVTLSGDLGAGDTLGLSGYDVTMNPDGTFDVVGTGLTVRYDGDTHTLTFTGDASVADYDALIDGIILTSTTDELAVGERTVSVTLTDDGNGATSTQSVTTNITATQSLTGSEHGNVRFTADGGIALPDQTIATDMTSVITALPGVAIAGDAGAIMDGMVVELSGDLDLGDALGLNGYTVSMAADGQFMVDGTGLTVAYDAAARTLTFDGEATVSAYNALIGGVILTSQNGELEAGDRTVTVTMKDDAGADTQSQSVTTGIDVDQILDGAEAGSAVFGSGGSLILPGQEVSSPSGAIPALNGFNLSGDVDDTLSGMTVELSGELGADDSLALSGMDLTMNGSGQFTVEGTNVVVSYNAEHSALEFTGDASLADYESIANGIILSSSDGKMEPGARTVSITTYDENGQASNPVSSTTTLTAEINLAGDDLGTVRWGADGTATVDDMIMVQYGSSINFVDGGENGTDSLYIQDADGVGNWLFTENDDGSILATSQTAGDDKSFVVNVEAGAAHIDEDGGLLTFNPDTSGHVTFDDGSMMQFENLERLLGN